MHILNLEEGLFPFLEVSYLEVIKDEIFSFID